MDLWTHLPWLLKVTREIIGTESSRSVPLSPGRSHSILEE